jgi:GxxExxY protein
MNWWREPSILEFSLLGLNDDNAALWEHLRDQRNLRSGGFMSWDPEKYKHQELTEVIIGAFYEVYNELGYGFLESVYQEAMLIVLREKGMTVEAQRPLPVWFRGGKIGDFRPDLIVGNLVVAELKAARALEPFHEAQLLNYLRASDIEVGLLLNFGPVAKIKRMVFANENKKNLLLSA